MPLTKINKTDIDWIDVKNKCRTTVNKNHSETEATQSFKEKLLISEHSPMRLLKINWLWNDIKSWIVTHYVRHHIGVEKWVSTQRTDRTGINRDNLPQSNLVDMEMEANAQALVNMAKVRLCNQASEETRNYMIDLKNSLHSQEETKEIANVMVPNCVYRCGCPEFQACYFWKKFSKDLTKEQLCDIQTRYNLYNEEFYNNKL